MNQSVASAIRKLEGQKSGNHVLLMLCRQKGDDDVEFNPKNKKSIERASRKFHAAQRDRKLTAFKQTEDGTFERTESFDPKSKATIMTPAMTGG